MCGPYISWTTGQGCQVHPGRGWGEGSRSSFHRPSEGFCFRVKAKNNRAGWEEHSPHHGGNSQAALGSAGPVNPDSGFSSNKELALVRLGSLMGRLRCF